MKIKERPEDFLVTEIPNRTWNTSGEYFVYEVTKRNLTTAEMRKRLAQQNGLRVQDIGYAGSKDRQAITKQYITTPKEIRVSDPLIALVLVGRSDDHLRLGDLLGNEFVIRVHEVVASQEVTIPNYFGDQRFSKNNVEVGLCFLRADYKQLIALLKDQYPQIQEHLERTPTDYIGALRRVPLHTLLMYVHSVQSYLFNQAVCTYVQEVSANPLRASYRHGELLFCTEELTNQEVPIPGAVQELGEWERYYAPTLRELRISPSQFYIKSFPQLTQEGTSRQLLADITDLSIKQLSTTSYEVRMRLGVGSYATVALLGLFKDC